MKRATVVIGDSIIAGRNLMRSSNSMQVQLSGILADDAVTVYARPGWSASAYIPASIDGAAALDAKRYVICLGSNDWSCSPLSVFRRAYRYDVIDRLLAVDRAEVICVTPVWRRDETNVNAFGLTLQDYREGIVTEAASRNLRVIDGRTMFQNNPDYFSDDTHLNDLGVVAYADALSYELSQ